MICVNVAVYVRKETLFVCDEEAYHLHYSSGGRVGLVAGFG